MKRQDLLILLWLSTHDEVPSQSDLADKLLISKAAVSYAVKHCDIVRLLSKKTMTVRKKSFLEFIIYGLPYIYPAIPGAIVRGIPTAASAPPLDELFTNEIAYVWQSADATHLGMSIEPLYKSVPTIVGDDPVLYKALALVDAIRIGHTRERNEAIKLLSPLIT